MNIPKIEFISLIDSKRLDTDLCVLASKSYMPYIRMFMCLQTVMGLILAPVFKFASLMLCGNTSIPVPMDAHVHIYMYYERLGTSSCVSSCVYTLDPTNVHASYCDGFGTSSCVLSCF